MRIVVFGSGGSIPAEAIRILRERHEIAAVIRPQWPVTWRSWLRSQAQRARRTPPPDPFRALVREHGGRLLGMSSQGDPSIAAALGRIKPDILCAATFPWILPEEILRIPRLAALNLHASLLPRHRGRNPWFWVYHSDDRETGVTVHYMDPRADAGAILGQERFPLPRAYPVERLHADCAVLGAQLLARCIDSVADGAVTATPQDEAMATQASAVKPDTQMIDFLRWPTERVWHFLAGLQTQYREPLVDSNGSQFRYRVLGFEDSGAGDASAIPGSLQAVAEGWKLHCRDGFVHLARRAD